MGWHVRPWDERHVHFDLVRCLAQRIDQDIFDDSGFIYAGSSEAFEWLLKRSNPSCKPRSPQESFAIMTDTVSHYLHPNMASLVRVAFGRKEIDRAISPLKNRYGSTLLHYAARYLGLHNSLSGWRRLTEKLRNEGIESEDLNVADFTWSHWNHVELNEDLLLIRDLVSAGSCICERNNWLHTPLLEVCHGLVYAQKALRIFHDVRWINRAWQRCSAQSPREPIRVWLEQLVEAGVDLIEYGRKESGLHLKHRVKKQWDYVDSFKESPTYGLTIFTLRLISFTYGPSPGDWQFWFTEEMDFSFLEFWHMVDHPEQGIPGAWNEYDGYGDDEIWDEDSEDDSSDDESCKTEFANPTKWPIRMYRTIN
jgi:hypothetical protein